MADGVEVEGVGAVGVDVLAAGGAEVGDHLVRYGLGCVVDGVADPGIPEGVSGVTLLDDGGLVVFADFRLKYRNASTSETTEIFEPLSVFDPIALTSISDGRVATRAAAEGNEILAIGHPATDRIDYALAMPFSPGGIVKTIVELNDGRLVVSSSHVDDGIYVWDLDEIE